MTALICALIGFCAGIFGGMFGVGGGIVIVPALVYLLGFNQKLAQGTSLAVLMVPVGFLSVMNYFKAKQMDITAGAYIALGFFMGGYIGSKVSLGMDEGVLRKAFAVFLVFAAVNLWFKK